jgi:predicted RNA-binding protein Jag
MYMESRNRENTQEDEKIRALLDKIQADLRDAITPVSVSNLGAFERKQVHRHFDRNSEIVTKTYRLSDDVFELKIYPVGNLRRYAEQKAEEAIQSGQTAVLPHMSSYERFVIHEALKANDAVKALSFGEGEERHIEIAPNTFGRGLKKIIKKIKLF